MDMKKLKKIKEHNVDSKFLVVLVLIMVVILLISTALMFGQAVKVTDSLERERTYRQYANELIETTEYFTDRVYHYVATGDEKYYDDYFKELNEVQSRENAVNGLLQLGVTQEEQDLITKTFDISNQAAAMEIAAFELVKAGNKAEALNLIFSEEYENYKSQIHENYNALKLGIEERVNDDVQRVVVVTKRTFFVSAIVGFGTTTAIILLLFTLFRINKESNIDHLTGLQNRNRYKESIAELIDTEPKKLGALLFCDIDNLKFINDCYGHYSGDRYIQATANVLKDFGEYPSVIARPSGDEFIVYIHGFDSKEEIIEIVDEKMKKAKNSYFTTSLHIEEKVRFSTGIAIYPTDTENVDDLIKYADYTMYKMKKNSKGEVAYYDNSTIDKTLFLAKNSGFLDEFLEKELLDFAMQPMVDAKTFKVIGYEALMRPQSDIISTPYLLLELAKAESKLDKIERLVMKKAFEKINENKETLKNYKIFINSIANQSLTKEEFKIYVELYPDILRNIVIEVTEQVTCDYDMLQIKTNMFKSVGALLAIDDFGAGYSNENSLLTNDYDIIKVDMNIIRNIDTDVRRQQIVRSMIDFSDTNNYKILAEGVETESEVKILRELGIHYMQGFFFGKPDIEIKGISDGALKFLEEEKINKNKNK